MRRHVFKSLAHSNERCYTYTREYLSGIERVNNRFRYYSTMGDGNTAHTPDMPIPFDYLIDYLYSLAQAMLTNTELCEAIGFDLRYHRADDAHIAFAASIKFKEGKTRYYSQELQQVSASDSKRHDKRFHEITSIFDGTIGATFQAITPGQCNPWQTYTIMWAISDWYRRTENRYLGDTLSLLKWNDIGVSSGPDLDVAYQAVLCANNAYEATARTTRLLTHYTDNVVVKESPEEKSEYQGYIEAQKA